MTTETRTWIAVVVIVVSAVVSLTVTMVTDSDTVNLIATVAFYSIMIPTTLWGLLGGKRNGR